MLIKREDISSRDLQTLASKRGDLLVIIPDRVKVCAMLSSYNGELYIIEQINTILEQT